MKELVCLLEEESAKAMLLGLLPRVLDPQVQPRLMVFEGKQDLEKQMVKRMRGYVNPHARLIVLRDQDSTPDCRVVKAKLLGLCAQAGRQAVSLVRIACHELESFYLADLRAVEVALGPTGLTRRQNSARFRTADRVESPSRELAKLTQRAYQKVSGSRLLGPHLDVANDRSASFKNLITGVRGGWSRNCWHCRMPTDNVAGKGTSMSGEFLLYQAPDGTARIHLRVSAGTVWLTQRQLAELYQVSVPTINGHLRTLYQGGELPADRTTRKFRIVAREAARDVERLVDHYNLEGILHVGYRVRSHRGSQFRRWATGALKDFLVKGFVLDDERFKSGKDDAYFEELLARIRDIRSSEKVFWKKVLDIYATSIDYDASTESSQVFFATVQNKMHWAAHGHTAAELVAMRADAKAPNMGLTSWTGASKGVTIRKADVSVAKNYLNEEELDTLNRIVTAYIEIAELQAQARRPMTMREWSARLDEFLRLAEREVLTHAGKLAAEVAQAKAEAEFDVFRQHQLATPLRAEQDFEAAISNPVKTIEKGRKPARLPPKKRSGS